ncbi:MAG: PQQ-binding-like beta-propeller repeat protein, partial [Candidatus Nanoarchaeia archaeon]
EDKLITAGYDCKLKIFKKENTGFVQIDSFIAGAFESTPLVFEGKIYIGSRDGYFYCLGEKEK